MNIFDKKMVDIELALFINLKFIILINFEISYYQGVLGMLNTEHDIFLGGAPDLSTLTGGRWDAGFQGCVYNITFYGEDVDFSSDSGEKIISTANIRPCQTLSTKEDEVKIFGSCRFYQIICFCA